MSHKDCKSQFMKFRIFYLHNLPESKFNKSQFHKMAILFLTLSWCERDTSLFSSSSPSIKVISFFRASVFSFPIWSPLWSWPMSLWTDFKFNWRSTNSGCSIKSGVSPSMATTVWSSNNDEFRAFILIKFSRTRRKWPVLSWRSRMT